MLDILWNLHVIFFKIKMMSKSYILCIIDDKVFILGKTKERAKAKEIVSALESFHSISCHSVIRISLVRIWKDSFEEVRFQFFFFHEMYEISLKPGCGGVRGLPRRFVTPQQIVDLALRTPNPTKSNWQKPLQVTTIQQNPKFRD